MARHSLTAALFMNDSRATDRACIFCGQPLGSDRNLEHVLPQWLLRRGGDLRRVVPLGLDRSGKPINLPFRTLSAPVHVLCNTQWSVLENQACGIVDKLVSGSPISSDDFDPLLDWLDKVRVGIWLQIRMRSGNPANITPNFSINGRVGAKDRFAAFYEFPSIGVGTTLAATWSPVFMTMPSVMILRVENVVIVSVSDSGIVSRFLGVPRLVVRRAGSMAQLGNAHEKIASWQQMTSMRPLTKPGMLIAQCIWPREFAERVEKADSIPSFRLNTTRSRPFDVLATPPRFLTCSESVPWRIAPCSEAITAAELVVRVLQLQLNLYDAHYATATRAQRAAGATTRSMQQDEIQQAEQFARKFRTSDDRG